MPTVKYIGTGGREYSIDVPVKENLMRGALYNDVEGIVGECGGGLSCATCHVYVDDAWTGEVGGPATIAEQELLETAASQVRPCSRLSCQIEMAPELEGLVVHLPERQY